MAVSSAKNSGVSGFKARTSTDAQSFGPETYGVKQAKFSAPGYSTSTSTSDGNNGINGVIYNQMTITGSTTLTVTDPGYAEVLMVGGGGGTSGGQPAYPAGGGGAGGVYYRLGTNFSAGTYNVSIGAGSAGGTGGDTSIAKTSGPNAPFTTVVCGGGGYGTTGPGSYGPIAYVGSGRAGSGGGGSGGHGAFGANPGRSTGPGQTNVRWYFGGTNYVASASSGRYGDGTGATGGPTQTGISGVLILRTVGSYPAITTNQL